MKGSIIIKNHKHAISLQRIIFNIYGKDIYRKICLFSQLIVNRSTNSARLWILKICRDNYNILSYMGLRYYKTIKPVEKILKRRAQVSLLRKVIVNIRLILCVLNIQLLSIEHNLKEAMTPDDWKKFVRIMKWKADKILLLDTEKYIKGVRISAVSSV